MLKGIYQGCFPNDMPLEELFATSRKAGYDAVELVVHHAGSVGLTLETTPAEAEGIRRMAEKHGIQLRSLSGGLVRKTPLSSADQAVRDEGRRVTLKLLELAEAVGADTVLVVPGKVDQTTSYEDCYTRTRDELRKVAAEAERRQVRIGVENVWNRFLLSPLEMARYIDELDSPAFGAYFDVGNVLQFGFPEQWIRILGHRIFKVHVKDFSSRVGNGAGFVPLLAGDVDWQAVRSALQDIGYDDLLTAEIHSYASAPLQAIYDTARHLDVIIGGEAK
ncbi:sugar phosphate isomerase/epimerase family protein [Paenibacillus sp. MBLB4367]|uniref:sugar phosphate isomerase/epimerase family protein n=1 Tax=Paenibacillus sp. MBLB4367 TaxID=3384767 RepID=UPI0039081898